MERVGTLGHRLFSIMQQRGLSYEQMGRLLAMKPQTLNRYVLGQREPKATVAAEMAKMLEVNLLWLIGYDVPKSGVPERRNEQTQVSELPIVERLENITTSGLRRFYWRIPTEQSEDLWLIEAQTGWSEIKDGQLALCAEDGKGVLFRCYHGGAWMILQREPYTSSEVPRLISLDEQASEAVQMVGAVRKLVRCFER